MPRATKDVKKEELNEEKHTSKQLQVSTPKKKTTTAKAKKATTNTKKSSSSSKVDKNSEVNKVSKTKTANKQTKNTSSNAKKKASTSTKKKSTTTRKTSSKSKKLENNIVAEYYDLPYRYNETVVKILYQTPNILFVYWDISDDDKENFQKVYGDNFFYNTKPILKVFNVTKGYSFEVEINDFANSWYINVNDANCNYKVELARRTINYQENLNTDYIYVSSSNNIEFPNDHILLEELPNKINFRNVKTNEIRTKDITTLRLIGINKIYRVRDFYKKLYKDEILEEIVGNKLVMPSSSTSSWS